MASSKMGRYNDPDELIAALRPAQVQHTIVEPGQFCIDVARVDLGRVWLRLGSENLARIARVEAPGNRHLFGFSVGPFAPVVVAGIELRPNVIVQHGPQTQYYHRIDGAAVWANLSIDHDAIAEMETMTERDLCLSAPMKLFAAPAAAMQRLLGLVRDAVALAENSPGIINAPWAATGLDNALFQALAECITTAAPTSERNAYRNHRDVLSRFDGFLKDHPDTPLFMPDVCRNLKTPLRTIRQCCHEHFGMGPKQFLMMRRLNQVRHALLNPTGEDVTVTNTATAFGFWELGRFSVAYKELFQESPSVTLRRFHRRDNEPANSGDRDIDRRDFARQGEWAGWNVAGRVKSAAN